MKKLFAKALAYFDSSRWNNEVPDWDNVILVPFTKRDRDEILHLFWEEHVNPKQIAIETGFCEFTVRRVLKRSSRKRF